jgi:hypothetical protein
MRKIIWPNIAWPRWATELVLNTQVLDVDTGLSRIGDNSLQFTRPVGDDDVDRRPGDCLIPMLAGDRRCSLAAGFQHLTDRLGLVRERIDHRGEVVADGEQNGQHLGGVAAQDVDPQGGVATGNARHVAQSRSGQRDMLRRRVLQARSGQDAQHLRHVRHEGDGAVVRQRVHHPRLSAEGLGDPSHRIDGLGSGLGQRDEHPRRALEQSRRCRHGAGSLPS